MNAALEALHTYFCSGLDVLYILGHIACPSRKEIDTCSVTPWVGFAMGVEPPPSDASSPGHVASAIRDVDDLIWPSKPRGDHFSSVLLGPDVQKQVLVVPAAEVFPRV